MLSSWPNAWYSQFLIEVSFPVFASSKQINKEAEFTLALPFLAPICFRPLRLFIRNQTFSNVRATRADSYFCSLEKEHLYYPSSSLRNLVFTSEIRILGV